MSEKKFGRGSLAVVIIALAAGAVIGTRYLTGASTAAVDALAPVGTVADIMRVLDPSADELWGAVATDVSVDGIVETAPADEEAWLALETHAIALAEAGNLLLLPGRRVDDDEWVRRAVQLREAGVAALAAVRTRRADAVLDVGEQITRSCDACHVTYWDSNTALLH